MGIFLFVVNFNLHGDMVPSSVGGGYESDDGSGAHSDVRNAAWIAGDS